MQNSVSEPKPILPFDLESKNKVIEELQKQIKELQGKVGDIGDTIIGKYIEDKYLVLARLGKGGGGSCYKAINKRVQGAEPICLKVIDNSDLSGMLEVFKQEIDALLAIDFPLIVSVRDSF